MKYRWITCLAVLLLFVASSAVYGKVYLDVYGQSYKKITIAAPPFKGESDGKAASEMNELLGKDLDLSGFFIVAPRSVMDRELVSEGIEKKEIRFENWRSIGVELISKNVLTVGNDGIVLETYLYDSGDGTTLFAKRYRAKADEWRRVVHRLADDIIQAVTGEKGIMSSRVLFVSGDGRRRDVYIADLDGNGMKKLTSYANILVSPALSPDGRYLAFTSYKDGKPNLYVVDLTNNREVYVNRDDGMKIGATWIDRRTVAFSHTSGKFSTIYSQNVETKEQRVLMRAEGILTSPNFTPDGRKMVFVSDMFGSPQVFVKDVGGGEAKRLSRTGNYNTSPAISPKGDLVAFGCKIGGSLEVCAMKADGSEQRVLTDGGINDSPQFSPCGRYILYSSTNKGTTSNVYLMLHNGENKRLLRYTGSEETQPKFVP